MKRKYAIHPGWIRSLNDEEWHFITDSQLILLYRVDPKECVIWDRDKPENLVGIHWKDLIHLFPNRVGNYSFTKERREHKNAKERESRNS